MNELRRVIENYRRCHDEFIIENFKYKHNGETGYDNIFDENFWMRKDLIFELYNDYGAEDRPLIKWLLKEERKGFELCTPVYTVDLCAFMLYRYMKWDDVYDLFEAKFGGGTDSKVYIDIELTFGFNRRQMKEYLNYKQKNKRKNKEIIRMVEYYESIPNTKFKSREEYIQYFETKKIISIKNDLEGV